MGMAWTHGTFTSFSQPLGIGGHPRLYCGSSPSGHLLSKLVTVSLLSEQLFDPEILNRVAEAVKAEAEHLNFYALDKCDDMVSQQQQN